MPAKTREVADGTVVLAAWDSNRFIELDRPGALDSPYARTRLRRWTVAGFSGLTGSYDLLPEGATGPRWVTSDRSFTPVPAGLDRRDYDPGCILGARDHDHMSICSRCWSLAQTAAGTSNGPEVLAEIAGPAWDEPGTYVARSVTLGWYMAGVGTIESVTTHPGNRPGEATATFTGPQGHRTFGLDTLIEATAPAGGTR